jgi:hypothetical protein
MSEDKTDVQDTPKASENEETPGKPGEENNAGIPGEAPKTETKDQQPERIVPDKYDLKPPENSPLPPKAVESLMSYAKEKGMTNDEAQALLERESGAVATYVDEQKATLDKLSEEWVSEIKKDPELGGNNFSKTLELSRRALEKFGTPELKEELEKTSLGNYPAFVKFAVAIGRAMDNDSFVKAGNEPPKLKSNAEVFYPETADSK